MPELSLNARRRIFRAVCYLAHADDELELGERALLAGLRIKLSLSEEDAEQLEAEGKQGEGVRLKPGSDEAEYAVKALILVMVADDVLHPDEARKLKHIASRVGVEDDKLAKMLKTALIKRNQRRQRQD